MRILFVAERGALLRFALLIPALAERGHEVHIAFASGNDWRRRSAGAPIPPPLRAVELATDLSARYPSVTSGQAPERGDDGWRDAAWIVRGLADLAHNAQPRYAGADVLRRRTRKRILGPLREAGEFAPLARRFALRLGRRLSGPTDARRSCSALAFAARLESAIPTSAQIDRYLRELAPDIVVATGTFRHVSEEVELLKSARRLGIPGGVFVASWDNLTNKGSLKFNPDRLFVWNESQVRDAVELHGIPRDRIAVTGAHVFDEWFERRPSRSREELLAELELDPGEPYLVYLCSSRNIVGTNEVDFVRGWVEALRASGDERLQRMNVIVRPHPNASLAWRGVELGLDRVVAWPAAGVHPVASDARADFFDTLAHAAAVVGINTTAMIEAAILGKSVLTVLVPGFAQETTLHFHDLLVENGGFLHVAVDLGEHAEQLCGILDEDEAGADRRRRFVESFVRPAGLDRPAAPIAAEAVERLGDVPAAPPAQPGIVARALISVARGRGRARPEPPSPAKRPAWEGLDELEEYRELCRVRLEHSVPVREPLVLISQVQRSGGTLLSRLFDGHAECHAHPYELKMGPSKAHRWPELDLGRPASWFDAVRGGHRTAFRRGLQQAGPEDGGGRCVPVPLLAAPPEAASPPASLRGRPHANAPSSTATSPRTSTPGSTTRTWSRRPPSAWSPASPRARSLDPDSVERFFAAYPDGWLVSLVRDPRAWYGSTSRHRARYEDLDEAVGVWRKSAEAALDARRRFGERVIVLTYEELVLETEAVMTRLAGQLGISMSPTLLVPTFNGRAIRANSSDPVEGYGVLAERAEAWRDVLDRSAIERIEELAGDLYERV